MDLTEEEGPEDDIRTVAEWILEADTVSSLTGAGISVESGIPDFRSKDGLWSKYDPGEYASVFNFLQDPVKVWDMLAELIETCEDAEPNPAHYALADLENADMLEGVITQNVDSLHQRAGSKNVIEFHGHNRDLVCQDCRAKYDLYKYEEEMPPLCDCGGYLRPDVVLFDEQIPMDAVMRARDLSSRSDLMLVIGTSAIVVPAAAMPHMTKANDGRIVEVNIEPTQLTRDADLSLIGKAGSVMPRLVRVIEEISGKDVPPS